MLIRDKITDCLRWIISSLKRMALTYFGGILMRWPWKLRRAIEPRPMLSRAMELETAKEILAEVFHARPGEVEEMIQRRLDERSSRPEEREVGLWPATFCVGSSMWP
jgi:hypothetical protein